VTKLSQADVAKVFAEKGVEPSAEFRAVPVNPDEPISPENAILIDAVLVHPKTCCAENKKTGVQPPQLSTLHLHKCCTASSFSTMSCSFLLSRSASCTQGVHFQPISTSFLSIPIRLSHPRVLRSAHQHLVPFDPGPPPAPPGAPFSPSAAPSFRSRSASCTPRAFPFSPSAAPSFPSQPPAPRAFTFNPSAPRSFRSRSASRTPWRFLQTIRCSFLRSRSASCTHCVPL